MNKVLLYHVSIAVCGGVLAFMGLSSAISGTISFIPMLISIGGIGMIFGAVYEIFISSDSSDSIPDDRIVWTTVALTLLAVIAGILSVIV